VAGNVEEINFYGGKGLGFLGVEKIIEFEHYLI
jgi:hypothetical protein